MNDLITSDKRLSDWIPKFLKDNGIRTLAELDGRSMAWTNEAKWLSPVHYTAYHRKPFADYVTRLDIQHSVLPGCEMVIWHCREKAIFYNGIHHVLRSDCRWLALPNSLTITMRSDFLVFGEWKVREMK